MKKEYVVDLIEPPKATSGARKIRRARILLLVEEGYIETEQRKNGESRTSYRTFAKLPGI
jgi:hypothetical protein